MHINFNFKERARHLSELTIRRALKLPTLVKARQKFWPSDWWAVPWSKRRVDRPPKISIKCVRNYVEVIELGYLGLAEVYNFGVEIVAWPFFTPHNIREVVLHEAVHLVLPQWACHGPLFERTLESAHKEWRWQRPSERIADINRAYRQDSSDLILR